MEKHFNIRVHGRVQGVFFRASARRTAKKLGLKGFVRNEPDGTVYMEVEGEEEKVREFIKWCGGGPETAEVESIDSHEGELRNLEGFSVL